MRFFNIATKRAYKLVFFISPDDVKKTILATHVPALDTIDHAIVGFVFAMEIIAYGAFRIFRRQSLIDLSFNGIPTCRIVYNYLFARALYINYKAHKIYIGLASVQK